MIARRCVLLAVIVLAASNGHAQDRKGRAAHAPRADGAAKADAAKTGDAESGDEAGATDEGEVRKEGESEVKVYEFGGLDIEGQLKTPQMLYFLNRLRAEFGRPRLPHRSFMPELQRSTRHEAF